MTDNSRQGNIDFIRGLMIILVVFGHSMILLLKEGIINHTIGNVR